MGTFRTLLGGLFDFAGMFPPASLEFEAALRTAAAFDTGLARPYLVGSEAVLAEERLADLTPERLAGCGFAPGQRLRVAVLGRSKPAAGTGDDRVGPAAAPAAGISLASYEIKVPAITPDVAPALEALMHEVGERGMRLYVEPEWTPGDWLAVAGAPGQAPGQAAERAAEVLAGLHARARGPGIGLKVRGSGPTAIDRPALAAVIAAVNARNLPFKATAGLHHPVVEPERYGNALGFLNLATALRLQKILGPDRFPAADVAACLGETDPGAFGFDGGLSWRGVEVGERPLAEAVRAVPFSIGSCSLHEPDEDLTRLFPGIRG